MIDPNGTIWQVQIYGMQGAPHLFLNFTDKGRAKEAVLAFDTAAKAATMKRLTVWHWTDDNDRLVTAMLPIYCSAACCNFEVDQIFARELTERMKQLQQSNPVGFGA